MHWYVSLRFVDPLQPHWQLQKYGVCTYDCFPSAIYNTLSAFDTQDKNANIFKFLRRLATMNRAWTQYSLKPLTQESFSGGAEMNDAF